MTAVIPQIHWLGTAGVELEFDGQRLLIDPYLSRVPIWNLFFGRPHPKETLIQRVLRPARAVLVTHSHYDHLMDVPVVCRLLGAAAFGSANTCALLAASGVPNSLRTEITPGDRRSLGPFSVDVFQGEHGRMLGLLPFRGRLSRRLSYPFRLADYRMDGMLSFRVEAGGFSVLVWNSPHAEGIPESDALLFNPLWGAQACAQAAKSCGARWVVPIHWDDFFSPLDKPLHPLVAPPGWGRIQIRRLDPGLFARSVESRQVGLRVIVPGLLAPLTITNP